MRKECVIMLVDIYLSERDSLTQSVLLLNAVSQTALPLLVGLLLIGVETW